MTPDRGVAGEAPTKLIRVDFACNDERGNHTGKAERVEIGDLELECTLWGGGVTLRDEKGFLWVGRRKFKHRGYKYGMGNWCWCSWWLTDTDVLEVIAYLERQKHWHCDSGPCEQFEKFNSAKPFTSEDLENCL